MLRFGSIGLLLLVSLPALLAQSDKVYSTKQINSQVTIDGHIDEKAWDLVKWEGGFVQTDPENGARPTYDTQFKILFDETFLYVAIRAFDTEPDGIVVINEPRDFFAGDYVEINIDSELDRQDAFSFTVTAAGIRGDEHILTSDNWFNDWNPDWTTATTIDDQGWLAELSIPLRELEIYAPRKEWGIQVNRVVERIDESSSWASVPDEDRWVEYFGLLQGVEDVTVAQVYSPAEKIESALLKADFDALFKSLRVAYPSLYRYRSPEFVAQKYTETMQLLETNLTLPEFYKAIASFLSTIGDGHIQLQFPAYFSELQDRHLKKAPFELFFTEQEALVVNNYTADPALKKARIVAIDGKPISEIVHEIAKLIPSDGYNQTGKLRQLSSEFSFFYSLITTDTEQIKLDYIPAGKEVVFSTEVAWLKAADLAGNIARKSHASFDYSTKEDVAILTIRTFSHAEGFQGFVDESFAKIADAGINKLILDFRGNGGGEESNAVHLYSYLAEKPFTYYDRYELGMEPQTKINQQASLISFETVNFLAGMVEKDKAGRNTIANFSKLEGRFFIPSELHQPKTENGFSGQLVVLIDGGSFSATSEICAVMKRDNRAVFMGEETGGAFEGNTSGISDQITLPNSRLTIRVPLIKYVSSTGQADYLYGRGIIPDHQLVSPLGEPDQLIERALEIFKME